MGRALAVLLWLITLFAVVLFSGRHGWFPEAISAWEESLKRAAAGDPLIQQIESRLGPVRAKASNSALHLPSYDRDR